MSKRRINQYTFKVCMFFWMSFFSMPSYAQFEDTSEVIESVRKDAIKFLVKKGELRDSESNLESQLNIFEIVKEEPLGFSRVGIFGFRSSSAPSVSYILLKSDSKYKILDVYNVTDALKRIIKFLKKHDFSKGEILQYIEAVIEVYRMNRYDSKIRL